jgi:NADPH-dependent 2,4-dienoyl-CoA reductase/sulfur reductase-like enzyme
MNSGVSRIEKNEEGQVEGVVLKNGEKLEVDLVIVGVGAEPNT